jgi:hypothetical protein
MSQPPVIIVINPTPHSQVEPHEVQLPSGMSKKQALALLHSASEAISHGTTT